MKAVLAKLAATLAVFAGLVLTSGALVVVANTGAVQADTISDIRDGVTGSGGTGAKNQGNQVAVTIRTVINILLFFIGAFAVIMIIIAGFRLVASNGDSNTVSSAKNTIIYAVLGIVVAFLAFALTNFVIDQITEAPATPPAARP